MMKGGEINVGKKDVCKMDFSSIKICGVNDEQKINEENGWMNNAKDFEKIVESFIEAVNAYNESIEIENKGIIAGLENVCGGVGKECEIVEVDNDNNIVKVKVKVNSNETVVNVWNAKGGSKRRGVKVSGNKNNSNPDTIIE